MRAPRCSPRAPATLTDHFCSDRPNRPNCPNCPNRPLPLSFNRPNRPNRLNRPNRALPLSFLLLALLLARISDQGPPQRQHSAARRRLHCPHRLWIPHLQLARRQHRLRVRALQAHARVCRAHGRRQERDLQAVSRTRRAAPRCAAPPAPPRRCGAGAASLTNPPPPFPPPPRAQLPQALRGRLPGHAQARRQDHAAARDDAHGRGPLPAVLQWRRGGGRGHAPALQTRAHAARGARPLRRAAPRSSWGMEGGGRTPYGWLAGPCLRACSFHSSRLPAPGPVLPTAGREFRGGPRRVGDRPLAHDLLRRVPALRAGHPRVRSRRRALRVRLSRWRREAETESSH